MDDHLQSIGELFFWQAVRRARHPFLHWRAEEEWRSWNYQEMAQLVTALAAALHQKGLARGDRVAILSPNRPEWLLTDLACLALGIVDVPIYPTSPGVEVERLLKDCGARFLFVAGREQWDLVKPFLSALYQLEAVVSFDVFKDSSPHLQFLKEWLLQGSEQDAAAVLARRREVRREDLATILYTSGTTGDPKGVMLSHGNLLSNCSATLRHIEVRPDDRTLSFLPLCHSFERTAGHYVLIAAGGQIAYASSVDRVPLELKEVQPTLVLGVPRFYEKMHARVLSAVEHSPFYRRRMFRLALRVGARAFEYTRRGAPLPGSLRWRMEVADRLVFSRLRERVGGRIRLLVSGGAPLNPEISAFFNHAGLPLLEGYGLTETSPVVTCNRPGAIEPGSVGQALPGVTVRIAEDGEVLVKGPNVMQGYYRNPEATREVLDEDGTFHTGDVGELSPRGFLTITDRKKELIISAGGKNLSPRKIEGLVKRSPAIAELCLIGDRRPYLVALIVPEFTVLKRLTAERGISWTHREEMLRHPAVTSLFLDAIENANRELAPPERIRRFTLLVEPFSQENRELTPTLKVRRKVIEERYRQRIEDLYREFPDRDPARPLLVPV